MEIIREFSDKSILYYSQGKFDVWCVYYRPESQPARALRDKEYFAIAKYLANTFGSNFVYDHFKVIYDMTGPKLEPNVLQTITQIATHYGPQELRANKLFTILYATMIAEENRPLPLRKKIKKLGMHQVLIEGMSPELAAEFSKNKSAIKELLPMIKKIEESGH